MGDLVLRDEDEFFKLSFLKRFLLGTNGIIAGGCFKNIFNGERVKDVDIFFRNKRANNIYCNSYCRCIRGEHR